MRKIDLNRTGPARHHALRDFNEVLVLNAIREIQPISRADIAAHTGLEAGTVSKIVARLLASGFVREEGVGPASPLGGRKKRFLHINPDKAYALGIDVGPREITIALSDFSGRILRSTAVSNQPSPQQAVAEVAKVVRKMVRHAPDRTRVEGIGVSLMGLIDPATGRVLAGENLGWGQDVPFGALLKDALQIELPIYFENDARLAALAELWFGKDRVRQARELVFLDVGEGIGSGIVIGGQIYSGSVNGAGEFGHISIDPTGPACSCGGRGCLEVFASDPATLRRFHAVCRTEGNVAGASVSSVSDLVKLARQGNSLAIEALRQTAEYLGRGLVPIAYSVNPELIVIGGPITEAWDIIYPELRRTLTTQVNRFYLGYLTIVRSSLEHKPSLVGCIALVLARAFSFSGLG